MTALLTPISHHHHTTTMQKSIPLKDVSNALMLARVRQVHSARGLDGKAIGRFAAYTQNPLINISCREACRGHRPHPFMEHHFVALTHGDLDRVVERVRCERGLAEVRRTWGVGLRALRAELSTTVMH